MCTGHTAELCSVTIAFRWFITKRDMSVMNFRQVYLTMRLRCHCSASRATAPARLQPGYYGLGLNDDGKHAPIRNELSSLFISSLLQI